MSTIVELSASTLLGSRQLSLVGIGLVVITASDAGLRELRLPERFASEVISNVEFSGGSHHLDLAESWLEKLAAGRDPGRIPSIDLNVGAFRRSVLDLVAQIPWGQTVTYGDLAERVGSSPRPVGGAVGANPLPLIVPCHRVLAASGKLGGFSGGLDLKRHLLALEGISWRE